MKKINNYIELQAERRRLERELLEKKELIKQELKSIRLKVDPILNLVSLFGTSQQGSNGKPSLLKIGTSVGIDVMRQTVLAKSGWLTKLVLPMVLKGISSKVIDKVQKR